MDKQIRTDRQTDEGKSMVVSHNFGWSKNCVLIKIANGCQKVFSKMVQDHV